MTTPSTLESKYENLNAILRELERVAVAFSAGVDSTFLLKAAMDALGRDRVVAVTGRSDSLAQAELDAACRLAEALGAEHVVLDTAEFEDERYLANPTNRCFHCKTALFSRMQEYLRERRAQGEGAQGEQALHTGADVGRDETPPSVAIVSGLNADDLDDFRPGIVAGNDFGVRAPLAEAGLTKREVRELSMRLGLPTHGKPASPCLSSRVPYGEPITSDKLRMIEAAEHFLHDLGLTECRVRHHGNLARIEVPEECIPRLAQAETAQRIDEHFRALGYAYVTLDLRGFRSGSLNEVISLGVSGGGR